MPGTEPNRASAEDAPSFEEAMERLERLVGELEAGELPLEQALARFEEGVRLARLGARHLEEAEQRIEELLGDEEEPPRTVPLEGTEGVHPAEENP